MNSNLPPGVSSGDIPGNRLADVAFENLYNEAYVVAERFGPELVQAAVRAALADLVEEGVNEQDLDALVDERCPGCGFEWVNCVCEML